MFAENINTTSELFIKQKKIYIFKFVSLITKQSLVSTVMNNDLVNLNVNIEFEQQIWGRGPKTTSLESMTPEFFKKFAICICSKRMFFENQNRPKKKPDITDYLYQTIVKNKDS